ncbi:hypothetical protein KI387_022533 [Taxus chinensis]|uniref:Uncharacterized protein n=1 Tax=Taxus chinensis TaxID=29808 RepID=A0AA38G069_TAXCH|nr:hypothetical protein KI387_022533 [Taxus chinensis]
MEAKPQIHPASFQDQDPALREIASHCCKTPHQMKSPSKGKELAPLFKQTPPISEEKLSQIQESWKHASSADILMMPKGYCMAILSFKQETDKVFHGGPRFMKNSDLFLKHWSPALATEDLYCTVSLWNAIIVEYRKGDRFRTAEVNAYWQTLDNRFNETFIPQSPSKRKKGLGTEHPLAVPPLTIRPPSPLMSDGINAKHSTRVLMANVFARSMLRYAAARKTYSS